MKIIKRLPYEDRTSIRKKNYPYSIGNEPVRMLDKVMPVVIKEKDIIEYPDMKKLYQKVSEVFDLPLDSFILTNGAESALRIAIEVAKIITTIPKDREPYFVYESPSWDIVPIVAQQCGFFHGKNMFKDELQFHVVDDKDLDDIPSFVNSCYHKRTHDPKAEQTTKEHPRIIYHNLNLNNIMRTRVYNLSTCSPYNTVNIIDNTYIYKPHKKFEIPRFRDDKYKSYQLTMVITSLSKIFGCGLRMAILSFNNIDRLLSIILDDSIHSQFKDFTTIELFNLFREQYINRTAYNFFVDGYVDNIKLKKMRLNTDNRLIDSSKENNLYLFENSYYRSIYKFIEKPINELYSYDWDSIVTKVFDKEIKPWLGEDLVYNKYTIVPIDYYWKFVVKNQKFSHVIIYRIGENLTIK